MSEYEARFLRINLSTGQIMKESVEKKIVMDFVGGRGFGVNYLYRELPANIDPLGEQNKLLFITGVLAGTQAQSTSRWLVCTKSPLTNCYGRSSVGGDFGAWLKYAGYDFLIIEGRAERPVYIYITNKSCQIKDAGDLWGKGTQATQEQLRQNYGKKVRTACIGPAGEKLVKYAAILTDRRAAARCGVGTVMGSKRLKAIVINTKRNVRLHDQGTFKQLVREQVDKFRSSKPFFAHKASGTISMAPLMNQLGIYPVRNFRYGQQLGYEEVSEERYHNFQESVTGCFNCAARCGRMHYVPSGPYAGAHSEGPEYETICMLTGSIDSTNIEATIAGDELCDDLGLDTISVGNCIGLAFELYERGILSEKDTDGLDLSYGNHTALLPLISKIASRQGLGDILAEGALKAAQTFGKEAEKYAMHVKGLELPGYDPRGAKAMGFSYATSNIGGSHAYGYASQEIFGSEVPRKVDRFAEEENAEIVIFNQDIKAAAEVGVVCSFALGWGGWFPGLFNKMLVSATGIKEFDEAGYLFKVGERIVNLERAFNVREGFNRKHDTLPRRMLTEPLLTRGTPSEGQVVSNLDKFLDRYYELRGWTKDGKPSSQKVAELGLGNLNRDFL